MYARRSALLAAALVTVVLVTGCTDPAPLGRSPEIDVSSAVAASAAAKKELLAALAQFQKGTYRYAVDADYLDGQRIQASGAHDPAAHRYTRRFTITGGPQAGSGELILIGDDLYTRTGDRSRWVHENLGVLATDNPLLTVEAEDPSGLVAFADAVDWTDRTGRNTLDGAFDPPAAGVAILPLGAPSMSLFSRGNAGYTATTDAQGHIVSIVMDLNTVDGRRKLTSTFSDHGKPVTITKPKKADL
ncbi:hypothetical protein [Actinoplanes sp. NPDC026623]|uniref:hypothetical protein n=1 Tax=Actinoplanes sp. NPDC026623 TaxID=3155610 RepID=UPI003401640E